MKKLLLSIILMVGIGAYAHSQVQFEFHIEVSTKVKNGQTLGEVQIVLDKGKVPVKYQILPLGDINAPALFESKLTKRRNYTFKNIPEGKYLAKLIDEEGRFAFQLIEIKID